MGKMTRSEDAAAFSLHKRGWSNRKIGRHLRRNHRSIATAIERHKNREQESEENISSVTQAELAQFWAWVDEGRSRGWDLRLMSVLRKEEPDGA
jgi:IS30 family transposase